MDVNDDFKNGSAFFGFMGVTMALVLASIYVCEIQISAPRSARPKLAQESAASQSGAQPS